MTAPRLGLLFLAAWLACASGAAYAGEPPRPRAGIVPLELSQVARAEGEDLRFADPDMTLAGKRVRFVGRVAGVGRAPGGEDFIAFTDGSAHVVLRLPGALDRPDRLAPDQDWEVIARLLRPERLSDGRRALSVTPDVVVKTPGLPAEEKPDDVIVQVAGATLFVDPGIEPYESDEPVYRLRITRPGQVNDEFVEPGRSAVAVAKDDQGRTMYNAIRIDRAADGRERTTSCIFRNDGGKLRNVALGQVEIDPAVNRKNELTVDFEEAQFNDTWSARKRNFEPNTYAAPCLGIAISGFPLDSTRVVRFYTWGGSGIPVPLYAYVDGEETLNVRGRPERARRIRVGLDVRQASKSIDVPAVWRHHAEAAGEVWFAGEATYWIAAERPHPMLRFQGPLGPPGAPEAVIERIR